MIESWKVHIDFHSKFHIMIQYVVEHEIINVYKEIFPSQMWPNPKYGFLNCQNWTILL
jgi:hypothetical protein